MTDDLETIIEQAPETRNNQPDECELRFYPINPIVREGADLMSAEGLAGVFSVASTYLAAKVTSSPSILVPAGPVGEKAGFVAWEAIKAVKDTIEDKSDERKEHPFRTFGTNLKGYWGNFCANLAADIVGHDIFYGAIMGGMLYAGAPPTGASCASFVAALVPAVLFKKYGGDIAHAGLKQATTRMGFEWERYHESRFIVSGTMHPEDVFTRIQDRFELGNFHETIFRDHYYQNSLPQFSDWQSKVRMREIETYEKTDAPYKALELAYTMPRCKRPNRYSEYNFFFSDKNKAMMEIENIGDAPGFVKKRIGDYSKSITFTRQVVYDDQLRLTLDHIHTRNGHPQYIIELKTFDDRGKLFDAMRELKDSECRINMATMTKDQIVEGDICYTPA